MAFTGHGHHIPGTLLLGNPPKDPSNCGGVNECPRCKDDIKVYAGTYIKSSVDSQVIEPVNYELKARKILTAHIDSHDFPGFEKSIFEIRIVTFTKTLQHWKAIMVTDMPDGKLYELVYDGDRQHTYINEYDKTRSTIVED